MDGAATPTLFSNWINFERFNSRKGGRVAPLVGSRREKLVSHRFGTPRIGSLGGQPNPLEVAVPVQIFVFNKAIPMPKINYCPIFWVTLNKKRVYIHTGD